MIIGAAMALTSCGQDKPVPKPETPAAMPEEVGVAPTTDAIAAAQAELRTEPKIKDLLYQADAPVKWNVGVDDDGSKRHGYAMYVCDVLKSHRATDADTIVRIVDIAKVKRGTSVREAGLGSVRCADYVRDPV